MTKPPETSGLAGLGRCLLVGSALVLTWATVLTLTALVSAAATPPQFHATTSRWVVWVAAPLMPGAAVVIHAVASAPEEIRLLMAGDMRSYLGFGIVVNIGLVAALLGVRRRRPRLARELAGAFLLLGVGIAWNDYVHYPSCLLGAGANGIIDEFAAYALFGIALMRDGTGFEDFRTRAWMLTVAPLLVVTTLRWFRSPEHRALTMQGLRSLRARFPLAGREQPRSGADGAVPT